VRAFEQGLLSVIRTDHPGILDDIRDTRDLTDATAAKLKAVLDTYAKAFA
jgi:F-type H+-transporting ATPase subunit alpha